MMIPGAVIVGYIIAAIVLLIGLLVLLLWTAPKARIAWTVPMGAERDRYLDRAMRVAVHSLGITSDEDVDPSRYAEVAATMNLYFKTHHIRLEVPPDAAGILLAEYHMPRTLGEQLGGIFTTPPHTPQA